MSDHTTTRYERIKQRWMEFWGLVFFLGVLINFAEIICRTVFHFSIDLMYDLPIWLTIWAVMMLAGPILLDGEASRASASKSSTVWRPLPSARW